MQLLQGIRIYLTVCGCSPPSSWTSPLKIILYKIYSSCVFLILHTLAVSEILDLIFIVDNQDDFSDNFYISVAICITCIKLCKLLLAQGNIAFMINTLQTEPFIPQDIEEVQIRRKFHKITEWNTFAYTAFIGFGASVTFISALFTNFRIRKLTFRAWMPYDYTSMLAFSLTYIYQLLGATICILTTAACDSLFSGLLIHIYCQFEILEYRLQNIQGDGSDSVKQCARHHSDIYKFAAMVNEEFKVIMFMQFLASTATICFDLYGLMKTDSDSKLIELVTYASSTLIQIFYYCWYGNEVKLKSLEMIDQVFVSNWKSFSNSSVKILLIIMRRAMEPIEFTSGYIVSIDLESFKALLKTSYSAFNLLQQTR